MRIDDEMLMAYADGELDGDARAAIERALAGDSALRDRLEAQRRMRRALSAHYGPVASEEVPERLLALLGGEGPREGMASLAEARDRRRPARRWRQYGAIAATLAVGLIAGQLLPSADRGPVAVEGGALVARGRLADALQTQLASAQGADAPTRIGVSFADRQGRLCRTFEGADLSGIACRDNSNWRLVATAAPERAAGTSYRQAGSSVLFQLAQDMMAGAPLDAAAEKAARDSGWKVSPGAD